jgi:hypothetical protein
MLQDVRLRDSKKPTAVLAQRPSTVAYFPLNAAAMHCLHSDAIRHLL